jgi:hypothetical protein
MPVYVLHEVWPYEYDIVLGVYSTMEALEFARAEYAAAHTSLQYVEFEVSTFEVDAPAQYRW